MTSKPHPAPRLRFRLMFSLAYVLGVSACVDKPSLQLTVPVDANLRQPCAYPPGNDALATIGDLAAYSVKQDAAIAACEAKRAGLVTIVDAHNAAVGKP